MAYPYVGATQLASASVPWDRMVHFRPALSSVRRPFPPGRPAPRTHFLLASLPAEVRCRLGAMTRHDFDRFWAALPLDASRDDPAAVCRGLVDAREEALLLAVE